MSFNAQILNDDLNVGVYCFFTWFLFSQRDPKWMNERRVCWIWLKTYLVQQSAVLVGFYCPFIFPINCFLKNLKNITAPRLICNGMTPIHPTVPLSNYQFFKVAVVLSTWKLLSGQTTGGSPEIYLNSISAGGMEQNFSLFNNCSVFLNWYASCHRI